MAIRVVLADDHPIVLDGLESLFQRERDLTVVARATDGAGALRAVLKHRPDVLVIDLRMPGLDGLAVLRNLQTEKLPTRVVLLAAVLEEDELLEAVRLGVRGVVLKDMAPQLLVQCIREVHAGRQWLERHSVSQALEKMLHREAAAHAISTVLTPREIEIVRAVASGLRNKQVAEKLGISEGTVKIHLHTVYDKLQVDGRMSLLIRLREKGFI